METPDKCPECGAAWRAGQTCEDCFHQMLFWENEFPDYGEVHHLTVLCYYLQHPSLYSPDGLTYGKTLLMEFVERGTTPSQIRKRNSGEVNSGNRQWKVTARPEAHGAYAQPVNWTKTAVEVAAAGPDRYCENVRAWAEATVDGFKDSGNVNY